MKNRRDMVKRRHLLPLEEIAARDFKSSFLCVPCVLGGEIRHC